eukprot:1139077-Pelagomonas_calceolata.AAC.10
MLLRHIAPQQWTWEKLPKHALTGRCSSSQPLADAANVAQAQGSTTMDSGEAAQAYSDRQMQHGSFRQAP